MNKFHHTHYFNMIEVALAMAVIAFGMISIMALFPVGLTASRNAVAENYSADAADQFMSYIQGRANADRANFDALFGSSGFLSDGPPDVAANMDTWSNAFLEHLRTGSPTQMARGLDIFECSSYGPVLPAGKQVFFITQGADNAAGLDFSAALVVWKSAVSTKVLVNGSPLEESDNTFSHYAGLNVEISWPLERPYAEREKRYYYLEIKRPE